MSEKVNELITQLERLHTIEVDRAVHRLDNGYSSLTINLGNTQDEIVKQIKIELRTDAAVQ
jgi:hypothetical protein